MAGSFQHVASIKDGKLTFRGIGLIENLRDAAEAIEEMFDMIEHLSEGSRDLLLRAHRAHCLKRYGFFEDHLWRDSYLIDDDEEETTNG